MAVPATQASAEEFKSSKYAPQGQWRLNTSGDGCTIIRDFASGENRLKFTIQQVHPGAIMQFGIFGDEVEKPRKEINAGFLPADSLGKYDMWARAGVGGLDGFVVAGFPFPTLANKAQQQDGFEEARQAYLARIEKSETYFVHGLADVPLELETGAMREPFEALEECNKQKLIAMGITDEVALARKSGPKPLDMQVWAKKLQENYPAKAARSAWDGVVNMRLVIGANGRVEHCHVITQMTAKVLRDAACNGMVEHARYTPAKDADGNSLRSLVLTAIRFTLLRGEGFSADAHGFKIKDD
ncbi:energy transducer TonB [Qipengyuania sp. 1NDH17]|uniref:Energy transducer TonB n=1 Tax=Qipengyuania polymorpha TaxID=2867234 RepID=A0ABS7IZ11_9SPHN|nr:energy transducer TonB [Qipengyuania polymorpha]MBX7458810.1 energy transducer TonB [Qipengyuania polymorpha]